jgi:hypothetical protein
MMLATGLTEKVGETSAQDSARHERVQFLSHERRQRPPAGRVGPLLLESEQVFLHHHVQGSLLRLPARIDRARGRGLCACRCLHEVELSASGSRKLRVCTYAPIDDLHVFETLKSVLGGRVQELCFVRLDVTDVSSQYAAVNREDVDLGTAKPDRHRNGFLIANSETGSRSLTLLAWIWRLVCTNGLVAPESSVFRMVHRRQKDGVMQAKLAMAVRLLPEYWNRTERVLRNARQDPVDDPHAALEVMVTAHPQLRPISESVFDAYEQDPEPTRFGLIQAVTRAAQALRPEDRLTVEEFAGRIAARAPELEESL